MFLQNGEDMKLPSQSETSNIFGTRQLSSLCLSGKKNETKKKDTVDGRNPAPIEVGNLPHYLQVVG